MCHFGVKFVFHIYKYNVTVFTFTGTRDRCTIRFQGEAGRKFKFCIRDLIFGECQVFIKVYDGLPEADVLNTARVCTVAKIKHICQSMDENSFMITQL